MWKWESYKTEEDLKNGLCKLKNKGNTFKIKVLDTNTNINTNINTNNVDEIIQIISRYGVFNNGIYTLAKPVAINQFVIGLKNKKVICVDVVDNNKNLSKGYKEYNNINKQIAEESIAFYS